MDEDLNHHISLAKELVEINEYAKAEQHVARVLEKTRAFADVHNLRGVIYYQTNRLPQAREAFEEALSINPRYTDAALNLVITLNELGHYDEAVAVSQRMGGKSNRAGKEDPFVRGKIANMHMEIGDVYAANAMYAEAVEEFNKALRLRPEFQDIRVKLAQARLSMGDTAEAEQILALVVKASPKYLDARIQHGVVLNTLGRTDEARAEWEEVLKYEPGNKKAEMYLRMTAR
ncbi:MAG: Beta-barrel assembly-enhancing protease [Myxococcota bacterium]|nr:Beta-barrel assembly-enhancing protease [Myxococcota bacterium]